LLRFRLGCHSLPCVVGRRTGIPRHLRHCALCNQGVGRFGQMWVINLSLSGWNIQNSPSFGRHKIASRRFMSKSVAARFAILRMRLKPRQAANSLWKLWQTVLSAFNIYEV
jgi:hypothetical protein